MRFTNLIGPSQLPDHEIVAYPGLDGTLVVCVQRSGTLVIRITLAPHGPPQVMLIEPPRTPQ